MREQIKKALSDITHLVGFDIFSKPQQFRGLLSDIYIDLDGDIVKNLLRLAIVEFKAFSRIQKGLEDNNIFIVDNLSSEMSTKYLIDKFAAQVVMECIAELLGYKVKHEIPVTVNNPFTTPAQSIKIIQSEIEQLPRGPAGGIIFCDKGIYSEGWRYLEVAPSYTETEAEWGAYSIDVSGVRNTLGSGKTNTELIVSKLLSLDESDKAAQLCLKLSINDYNDWFLPSMYELNLMYEQLSASGYDHFSPARYWSSSQTSNYYAWLQSFGNGSMYGGSKSNKYRVRAIRMY
jgi:hypothetical protein